MKLIEKKWKNQLDKKDQYKCKTYKQLFAKCKFNRKKKINKKKKCKKKIK